MGTRLRARQTSSYTLHDGTEPAGPLETPFTMPDSCTDENEDEVYQDPYCMPPDWENYSTAGYYSPAICPADYEAACTLLANESYPTPYLEPEETAVYCCPSGFLCDSSYEGTAWCASSTAYPTYSYLWGYAIQVRWQESDLADLATSQTTPDPDYVSYFGDTDDSASNSDFIITVSQTVRETVTAPVATPPTRILLPSSTASSTSARSTFAVAATKPVKAHGMSTGAKVGIGVAAPIAFLGIVAAAIAGCLLLLRRRKSKSKTSQSSNSDLPEVMTQYPQSSAYYATMEKSIQMTQSPEDPAGPSLSHLPRAAGAMPFTGSFDPQMLTRSPSPSPHGRIGMATTTHDSSPASPSPSHGRISSLPEVVMRPGDDQEIRMIQLEQARLQEKKSRLTQMAELDQEEERLQRRLESRMTQIGGQTQGS